MSLWWAALSWLLLHAGTLVFLLVALTDGVGAEQTIEILPKDGLYFFISPRAANFCVMSRSTGEETLMLWNTSHSSPRNSMLPEDLRERLQVSEEVNAYFYEIHNLTFSDSGLYRMECWTEGNMTHQMITELTVCGAIGDRRTAYTSLDWTLNLTCEGANDNLTLQVVKDHSSLHFTNYRDQWTYLYSCLVMDKQQCISSHPVEVTFQMEIIYHRVGDSAVLQCANSDFSDEQKCWDTTSGTMPMLCQNIPELFSNVTDRGEAQTTSQDIKVNQNFSLVFPPLTLKHTSDYTCSSISALHAVYFLVVCPDFAPADVQLYSKGDEITLRCDHDHGDNILVLWFRKKDQVEGPVYASDPSFAANNLMQDKGFEGRVKMSFPDKSLIISDVSLEDGGEYWCAAVNRTGKKLCESITVDLSSSVLGLGGSV
uniref:Ig-like domain-containing protein n=1 Tax=Myripristis murdjan TaxID=586833 RepID=A0A667ZIJ7_9TELE